MNYKIKNRDDHLQNDGHPKRILALDGGGLRGILTIGLLQRIEDILRERHGGDKDFRLSHYFDLIAGTSTGSIIAATLALGWSVEDIRQKYMQLGQSVFKKSLLRHGFTRAKYDEKKLIKELKSVYGARTKLGSSKVKTGLLVITKRIDTGSPWPINNNPRGRYFSSRPGGTIGNGDYTLWQVVRASTAAPAFFDPQSITIAEKSQHKPMVGEFIDGGMSPYNNPALQALMYVTLNGYRVGWPTGSDKLQIVSIGTGSADPAVKHQKLPAAQALVALLSLMDDSANLQETILQWMSSSSTAKHIDREQGDLQHDLVSNAPLLSYLRYNVDLSRDAVMALDPTSRNKKKIEDLSAMDAPKNMKMLHRLGVLAGQRDVRSDDFATQFDLSCV